MSRRIDVELTSDRGDGVWTWRAAGAKQPKGELDGSLLPDGSGTGDVLTAEADFDIDGITIVSVAPPKRAKRVEPERLEILGSGKEEAAVTTTWVERKGGGKGRGDKGRGGPRGRGRGGDGDDRGGRGGGGRGQQRSHTPAPPERPKKPKAPRLRPRRTHRDAALAALTEAERPVAEQALKGGIPAVRDALRAQNEENKKAGRPIVAADAVLGLAEQLLPRLKTAEWHDRAEAAVAQMDKVDLRDLRSVVTASEGAARDDETRALAEQLRTGLAARVESDHGAWLAELAETLADGRVARALNLSSRPPKAGAPLPVDMAERLAAAASAGLTSDVGQKRWQTVLESVARSPVRQSVVPEGVPANPSDELLEVVRNLSMQVPQIAAAFGIEPQKPSRKRRSRKGSGPAEAKGGSTTDATRSKEPAAAPRIPPPPTLPSPAEPAETSAEGADQASSDPVGTPEAAATDGPAAAHEAQAPEAQDTSDASTAEAAAEGSTTPDTGDTVDEPAAEAPAAADGSESADQAEAQAPEPVEPAATADDASIDAAPEAEDEDEDAARSAVADEEE